MRGARHQRVRDNRNGRIRHIGVAPLKQDFQIASDRLLIPRRGLLRRAIGWEAPRQCRNGNVPGILVLVALEPPRKGSLGPRFVALAAPSAGPADPSP